MHGLHRIGARQASDALTALSSATLTTTATAALTASRTAGDTDTRNHQGTSTLTTLSATTATTAAAAATACGLNVESQTADAFQALIKGVRINMECAHLQRHDFRTLE